MAAFLAHNVEEVALDLPAWRTSHQQFAWLGWMETPGLFATAVGVLSLAVGAIALYAMSTAPRWSRAALAVFATIMLVNAASHILLSIMTQSLMPGAVTAAVLIVPIFTGVLWAIRR